MTAPEARKIDDAIRLLAVGRTKEAFVTLCRLRRMTEPEIAERVGVVRKIQRATAKIAATCEPLPPRGRAVTQAVGPQTRLTRKGRIKSEQAIAVYKAEHPACEIAGPDCDGPLDFSHLISRQRGGNDAAENGLVKCRFHHQAWHTVGRLQWVLTYGDRLSPETLEKVKRAFKVNATEQVA